MTAAQPTTGSVAPHGSRVDIITGGRPGQVGQHRVELQAEPAAHFGLGPVNTVDQIRVQRPDKTIVTQDEPVEARRRVTLRQR